MVKGYDSERAADQAEGVDIGFVRLAPAVERDAEFVGAAGGREELRFVYTQRLVEQRDGGDCRFANADDPDLIGFD